MPEAEAVPPGQVYFWPDANQMGQGGAWACSPPGHRELGLRVKRHAYSFGSRAPGSVFAIGFQPGGGYLFREIRPDDYDNNWTAWAMKIDGCGRRRHGLRAGLMRLRERTVGVLGVPSARTILAAELPPPRVALRAVRGALLEDSVTVEPSSLPRAAMALVTMASMGHDTTGTPPSGRATAPGARGTTSPLTPCVEGMISTGCDVTA